MGNVRICHRNYLQHELLIAYSSSSVNSEAPLRNIFPDRRRSQTWRSNGNFVVTSLNKVIMFEETVSVPLTATIAEGTYGSDALFFAAVKAAFEANGDSTYTVSRDSSTKKIRIVSGGGSGRILNLLWDHTSTTAEDLLGFDNSASDTGSLDYLADDIVLHTEEWIKFDLGDSSNPKGFIITGPRNGSLGISSTAIVKLQANNSDSWFSPALDLTLAYSDKTIFHFDTSGIGSYRYWRLVIIDQDNANGYVEFSKIFLGDVIEPTQGAIQFPFRARLADLTQVVESQTGVSFANERQKTMEMRFNWLGLRYSEVEELRDFWEDVGLSTPFFIHIDPNLVLSSDPTKWLLLARFISDPDITIETLRIWGGDWEIREVV